jgi:hypothetical protein
VAICISYVDQIAMFNPANKGELKGVDPLSGHDRCDRFLPGVFPLFPLFPLFFDGTEMQYCWKNWLVVKVRSLRAGLWLQYSTYVLYWQIRKVLRNGMLTHTPIHPEYQGRGEASHHELSASPQCIIDRRFAPTIKINHWPVLESWTFFVPTTFTQPAIP